MINDKYKEICVIPRTQKMVADLESSRTDFSQKCIDLTAMFFKEGAMAFSTVLIKEALDKEDKEFLEKLQEMFVKFFGEPK